MINKVEHNSSFHIIIYVLNWDPMSISHLHVMSLPCHQLTSN